MKAKSSENSFLKGQLAQVKPFRFGVKYTHEPEVFPRKHKKGLLSQMLSLPDTAKSHNSASITTHDLAGIRFSFALRRSAQGVA